MYEGNLHYTHDIPLPLEAGEYDMPNHSPLSLIVSDEANHLSSGGEPPFVSFESSEDTFSSTIRFRGAAFSVDLQPLASEPMLYQPLFRGVFRATAFHYNLALLDGGAVFVSFADGLNMISEGDEAIEPLIHCMQMVDLRCSYIYQFFFLLLIVLDCEFIDNAALSKGGAVALAFVDSSFTSSVFSGLTILFENVIGTRNEALNAGGFLDFDAAQTSVVMVDCTVENSFEKGSYREYESDNAAAPIILPLDRLKDAVDRSKMIGSAFFVTKNTYLLFTNCSMDFKDNSLPILLLSTITVAGTKCIEKRGFFSIAKRFVVCLHLPSSRYLTISLTVSSLLIACFIRSR